MTEEEITASQTQVCTQYNVDIVTSANYLKVGISLNVTQGVLPINGLRHPPEGDTSGWYLWAGEVLSDAPDFFEPMHIEHLKTLCPSILKYLGLPPGYRFIITGNYEDVWRDESLLNI